MPREQWYQVTNLAGTSISVKATSETDALLRRCRALAEAAELAKQQGIRGRRLDPMALPGRVEVATEATPPASEMFGSGEGIRTYRVPSDRNPTTIYTVTLVDEHGRCECPGFVSHQPKPCKHIRRFREMEACIR